MNKIEKIQMEKVLKRIEILRVQLDTLEEIANNLLNKADLAQEILLEDMDFPSDLILSLKMKGFENVSEVYHAKWEDIAKFLDPGAQKFLIQEMRNTGYQKFPINYNWKNKDKYEKTTEMKFFSI